jgi:hypothetical protein
LVGRISVKKSAKGGSAMDVEHFDYGAVITASCIYNAE